LLKRFLRWLDVCDSPLHIPLLLTRRNPCKSSCAPAENCFSKANGAPSAEPYLLAFVSFEKKIFLFWSFFQ
jgi:hypothetical protein